MLQSIASLKSILVVTAFSFGTGCVSAQIAHFSATASVYFTEGVQPISIGDIVHFSAKIDLSQTPTSSPGPGPNNRWLLHDYSFSIGPVSGVAPFSHGHVSLFEGLTGIETALFSAYDANFLSLGMVFNYDTGHMPSFTSLVPEIFANADWTNWTYNNFDDPNASSDFRGSASLLSYSFSVESDPTLPSSAVPEPSTYGLIGIACLAGLIALRRHRR